jgi:predicted nucleic acid-binding Zn ribbon protein
MEIKRLLSARGWEDAGAQARLFGAWDQLVGPELAEKCRPVALRDGELTVAATSTAWATQLRMLSKNMLAHIRRALLDAGAGSDLVRQIKVHGPVTPSWKRGGRSVPGRGPRDTYG